MEREQKYKSQDNDYMKVMQSMNGENNLCQTTPYPIPTQKEIQDYSKRMSP